MAVRCLECHGLKPDVDECVDCMGTGRDMPDDEWGQLHDEFLALVREATNNNTEGGQQ